MEPEEQAVDAGERVQARVFGEVADEYERTRPGYPEQLFDDVLGYVGPPADSAAGVRALEVGAGTGKATLPFAARGVAVTALEPDPAMAAVLARRLTTLPAGRRVAAVPAGRAAAVPAVTIRTAAFEEHQPAGNIDLLYSAQAWHWTDPSTRWQRAAATLRPGGTIALFWNRDLLADRELAEEVLATSVRLAPELDVTHGPVRVPSAAEGPQQEWREFFDRPELAEATERRYDWRRTLSATDATTLIGTHSRYRMLPEATRTRVFDAFTALLPQTVEFEVRTWVYLARRRGGPLPE